MQEQSRRLSEPLRWTRAGRVAVIAAAIVLIAGTVAAIVAFSGGTRLAPGCVRVAFPSTLGVAEAHPCGARARALCAEPGRIPGLAEHGALREACRRAGLPYG